MYNNNFMASRFFCTKCGKEGICLARKKGSKREKGHLKRLYCIHCKEEINHAEVTEDGDYTLQDFQREFEQGVFNEEGKRR